MLGWQIDQRTASDFRFSDPGGLLIGRWMPGREPAREPAMMPFFYVDDVDAAVAHALAEGGETVKPVRPEGDIHVAQVRDPAGNAIGPRQFMQQPVCIATSTLVHTAASQAVGSRAGARLMRLLAAVARVAGARHVGGARLGRLGGGRLRAGLGGAGGGGAAGFAGASSPRTRRRSGAVVQGFYRPQSYPIRGARRVFRRPGGMRRPAGRGRVSGRRQRFFSRSANVPSLAGRVRLHRLGDILGAVPSLDDAIDSPIRRRS